MYHIYSFVTLRLFLCLPSEIQDLVEYLSSHAPSTTDLMYPVDRPLYIAYSVLRVIFTFQQVFPAVIYHHDRVLTEQCKVSTIVVRIVCASNHYAVPASIYYVSKCLLYQQVPTVSSKCLLCQQVLCALVRVVCASKCLLCQFVRNSCSVECDSMESYLCRSPIYVEVHNS